MNKITKLVLRLLKENDLYQLYMKNNMKYIMFRRQLKNIALPWFNDMTSPIYLILNKEIDIKKYKAYTDFKHVIIYNIKNVEKLFSYFINNGIIWGGGNECTMNSIPRGFNPTDKDSYLKLYNRENRIYYGVNFIENNFLLGDNALTEDEFYDYYEQYKKKINDNFERFLIKK